MGGITRHWQWQSRLERYLRDCYSKKFLYGGFDCCTFACKAIEAISDTDPMEDFFHNYKNEKEAIKQLKNYGRNLEEVAIHIATRHSLSEVEPMRAQRGDVCYIKNEGNEALGIISMNGIDALTPRLHGVGLQRYRLSQIKRAWRIG